jgi:putative transposase
LEGNQLNPGRNFGGSLTSPDCFLKGKSAIKTYDMHLELKKLYWGWYFGAKGYCVSTVGLDEKQIRKTCKSYD